MNTQNPLDPIERRIDMALGRLPEWQPPQDFSVRLAAAAARQSAEQPPPAEPAWLELLDQTSRLAPTLLASAGLAATMGWIVPWSELSTIAMVWTCIAAMSAAGVVLVLRVLRTS